MTHSQRKNLDKRSTRRFVKQYLYAFRIFSLASAASYREVYADGTIGTIRIKDPFSILVGKVFRGLVDFNPEYDVSYGKVSEVLREEMVADGWEVR